VTLEGQTTKPSPSRKGENFHALLIGIDKYKHSTMNKSLDLAGCEGDVNDWFDFLQDRLEVSSNHIITLYNEDATRANIKAKLQDIAKDEKIKPGDAILIFFAGHGALAPIPEGWNASGSHIQMLIPHDFDPSGRDGAGLHDYTFNFLLRDIADKKGNNIVCPWLNIGGTILLSK
jgi:hypothetical protein